MTKIIIPSNFRNDAILQEREGGQIATKLEQKPSSAIMIATKKPKKSKIIGFMSMAFFVSTIFYLFVATGMSENFKKYEQSEIVSNATHKKSLVDFVGNITYSKLKMDVIQQVQFCAINKVKNTPINVIEIWHYRNVGANKNAGLIERECGNELILKSAQNNSTENASAFRHAVVSLGYKTDANGIPNPLIMNDEMKDLWTK